MAPAASLTINNGGTVAAITNSNSLLGSSGIASGVPTVTINAGGTLTTAAGLTDHLSALTLAGGTLASGTPNASTGSWNLDDGVTVSAGTSSQSTISATGVALTETGGTVFNVGQSGAVGGIDLNVTGTLLHYASDADTGIVKNGIGVMELSGVNTYTGATTISAGTLQIGGSGSLGGGNYAGAIANSGTLQFSSSTAQTFSGSFSGSGGLTVTAGTLTLTATGTYTGATTVDAGTLVAGTSNFVTGISGSSAVFLGNTTGSSAATLQLGLNSSATYANNVTVQSGNSGLMTLNAPGNINLNGTVTLGTAGSAGQSLTIADPGNSQWFFILNGVIRDPTSLTGTAGAVTIGTGNIGTVEFTAANTYTGNTMVNGGTLELTNNLGLQNSTLDTSGVGHISLTVTTPTIGGLIGSTALASVANSGYTTVTALTLNPGTGVTDSYSGVIANGASGMTLAKTGAGTQILAGANTYAGGTTISAGTLRAANSSGSATGTLGVAVNSGGTLAGPLLASQGFISGLVSVGSGGAFSANNSIPPPAR